MSEGGPRWRGYLRPAAWTVLLVAVLVNYVTTPLGSDVQINVAFAQQADLIGPFPGNLLEAWTLRGPGYKLLSYLFYEAATLLVGYEDKRAFAIAFRSLYAGGVLALLGTSTIGARETLREWSVDPVDAFFVASVTFLSTSQIVSFQAEEITALAVVFATSLAVSESRVLRYLAAVVLGLTFTLKGVTLLLGPVAVVVLFGVEGGFTRRFVRVAAAAAVAAVVVPLGTVLAFPGEIDALLQATAFESTFGASPFGRVYRAGGMFVAAYEHLPVLLPGLVVGVLAGLAAVWRRRWIVAAVLAGMALVPFATVVIQGQGGAWYGYHLAGLLPTALFLLLGLLSAIRRADPRPGIVPDGLVRVRSVVVALGLCWLLMTSPVSLFDGGDEPYSSSIPSSSTTYRDVVAVERAVYGEIEREFGLTAGEEVLYLADGVPTYYLESRSYLRYYYPLPIERADRNPALRDTDVYRATIAEALRYDGRVVVHHHEWLALSDYPRLQRKLEAEYCRAYRNGSTVQPVTVLVRDDGSGC
jgi:hypothetical protein